MFHTWRSLHFHENAKTVDAYLTRIRQVASMPGYGDPQILKVIKNTMPSIKYLVMFGMENLRATIGAVKRILIKEKLHRQMSSSLFSSISSWKKPIQVTKMFQNVPDAKIGMLTALMNEMNSQPMSSKPFK